MATAAFAAVVRVAGFVAVSFLGAAAAAALAGPGARAAAAADLRAGGAAAAVGRVVSPRDLRHR